MSIFVALHHVTHYKYDRPIDLGPQVIRLRPAPHTRTPILSLFAEGHAGQPFRELAAGSARQLAGALRLSGEGDRIQDRGRPHRADDGDQSVRLLRRALRRAASRSSMRDGSQDRACALSRDHRRRGRLFKAWLESIPREADSTVNFLVELNAELQKKIRYIIRMEPGVQTPEETLSSGAGSCRDSAWLLVQTLRHLGLAARFVSGYLIQLRADIDPIEGPVEVDERFHRPARLGRSLSARAPAGSASTRPPACSRRGPHSARRDAALPLGGADYRQRRACQGRVRLRDERQAHPRSAARHPALHRRRLGASSTALGETGRSRSEGPGRAPDHGRRADLRLDRRSSTRRNGTSPPVGPTKRGAGRRADPASARALRAGRASALRPGQMVSRRKPAALGLRALLAQGRRADLEERRPDRRRSRRPRNAGDRRRRALRAKSPRGSASSADYRHAGLRGPDLLAAARGALPVNVDPADPRSTIPKSARAWCARSTRA